MWISVQVADVKRFETYFAHTSRSVGDGIIYSAEIVLLLYMQLNMQRNFDKNAQEM